MARIGASTTVGTVWETTRSGSSARRRTVEKWSATAKPEPHGHRQQVPEQHLPRGDERRVPEHPESSRKAAATADGAGKR